jgi:hypothetical protein
VGVSYAPADKKGREILAATPELLLAIKLNSQKGVVKESKLRNKLKASVASEPCWG